MLNEVGGNERTTGAFHHDRGCHSTRSHLCRLYFLIVTSKLKNSLLLSNLLHILLRTTTTSNTPRICTTCLLFMLKLLPSNIRVILMKPLQIMRPAEEFCADFCEVGDCYLAGTVDAFGAGFVVLFGRGGLVEGMKFVYTCTKTHLHVA